MFLKFDNLGYLRAVLLVVGCRKRMARIVRRSLQIKELPLFSLGKPWQSVCDESGSLALRFFEPRYVELARRVCPPSGAGNFGYAENYPPKVGSSGVLAQIEKYAWEGAPDANQTALIKSHAAKRFRILSVREEKVNESKAPLYVARVQLLTERDTSRGPGVEAMKYWSQGVDGQSLEARPETSPKERKENVKSGTPLVAKLNAPVFDSTTSWQVVAQVPLGVAVVAAGPPTVVDGYLMVPIVPSGAVELTLFRELTPSTGDETEEVCTEDDLRAALLDMGRLPERWNGASPRGGRKRQAGRKSNSTGK